MEDFSKMSVAELEQEQTQCRAELKFAKKLGRNQEQIIGRFNLLTRELNSRSGA